MMDKIIKTQGSITFNAYYKRLDREGTFGVFWLSHPAKTFDDNRGSCFYIRVYFWEASTQRRLAKFDAWIYNVNGNWHVGQWENQRWKIIPGTPTHLTQRFVSLVLEDYHTVTSKRLGFQISLSCSDNGSRLWVVAAFYTAVD